MNWVVRNGLRFKGSRLLATFDTAARDPRAAQEGYLRNLLQREAGTAFGIAHAFDRIGSPEEYARRVPVRDYEGLRAWVERLLAGERRILTVEDPVMFATTSGTSAQPKMIPVTPRWLGELSRLTTLWLYCALVDHPGLLSGKLVSPLGAAVEGTASDGTPVGSVSGLTYQRMPWLVRRTYALPYEISLIADYDHRYLAAARIMLASDASMLAAPNPSTLLRLAQEGRVNGERILRAVRDGTLGVRVEDSSHAHLPEQRAVYGRLEHRLRPEPGLARRMEACLGRHGTLRPADLWPRLAMVACWLGGSAGAQAERLCGPYGEVPLRDLGFRATEATITVPVQDATAAAPLALDAGFFEFIPEECIEDRQPTVLLAHELAEGKRYYILLTTSSGLYRYDINDIVEVRGFYDRAPQVAFVRKGRDMVSITGEKLHSSQIAEAAERSARQLSLQSVQVQVIPDQEGMCYDLLVEAREGVTDRAEEFARVFDEHLAKLNIEYEQKRTSRRLGAPRVHHMRTGWAARRRQLDVEKSGKRDAQYKWPLIRLEWDEATRSELDESSPDEHPKRR